MSANVLWIVEVMPLYGDWWLPVFAHPCRCVALHEMTKYDADRGAVARVSAFFRGDIGVERVPSEAEAKEEQ